MIYLTHTLETIDVSSRLTFKRHESIPMQPEMLLQIVRGVVRTVTWNDEGIIVSLGYWGSGDVVGQPLSKIQPYQVECMTNVEVSYVPTYHRERGITAIQQQLQQVEELLSIIHHTNARTRLLQMLLWLARKFARPVEQGQLLDLRLTHQELAELTGITRVSVTRFLSQLERVGVISRPQRHSIVLLER